MNFVYLKQLSQMNAVKVVRNSSMQIYLNRPPPSHRRFITPTYTHIPCYFLSVKGCLIAGVLRWNNAATTSLFGLYGYNVYCSPFIFVITCLYCTLYIPAYTVFSITTHDGNVVARMPCIRLCTSSVAPYHSKENALIPYFIRDK